ncbi:MAG TPA: GDSL-type esterase/lipase family protein, partial [Pirellulaceae bacterium]
MRIVMMIGFLSVALAGIPANGIHFDHVVALGDSLFDDTAGTRSPVAAEHLARVLGAPLTNLAQSGASSSTLLSQGQHTSAAAQFGTGDLALVWIGGNDFFQNSLPITFGSFGFLNTLQSNVNTAVTTLRSAGMEVVLFNLLDMSRVPLVQNAGIGAANFRAASLQWRTRLQNLATAQGASVVDVFTLFDELVADPTDFSILGHDPVLGPDYACTYCVFADTIHPSSLSQGFVSNTAITLLNQVYDPMGAMPLNQLTHVELARLVGLLPGDFNTDGSYGIADID